MEDLFLLKEDIHKTWTGMRLRLTCLERFSMLHALHVEITLEFLAWAAAVQVLVSCEFFFFKFGCWRGDQSDFSLDLP